MAKPDKQPRTEPDGDQRKPAEARRGDARDQKDSFQPHNAKKEGLGPNTKR